MLERVSVFSICGIRVFFVLSIVNLVRLGERDSREDRILGRWFLFFVLLLGLFFLLLSDR